MKTLKSKQLVLIALFSSCAAYAQQELHVHTPWPVVQPQVVAPPVIEAHAPTPRNIKWEREKMQLQHEYKMRELRANAANGGAKVEDEILMLSSESPRGWYSKSGGRLASGTLASYNRKTGIVKINSGRKGRFERPLSTLSKDDQIYVLKQAMNQIP